MTHLLEISNANVWRGETLARHDFSLHLNLHQRIAILGPNGAGKAPCEIITLRKWPWTPFSHHSAAPTAGLA